MEEGELKKRIQKIEFPCYEWAIESNEELVKKEIQAVLDEAKQEFPEVLLCSEMQKKYGAVDWVHAVNNWFLKWFGVKE